MYIWVQVLSISLYMQFPSVLRFMFKRKFVIKWKRTLQLKEFLSRRQAHVINAEQMFSLLPERNLGMTG